MMVRLSKIAFVFLVLVFGAVSHLTAQPERFSQVKSQEVSDIDGLPVLLKHLPEWDTIKDGALFFQDNKALKTAFGERKALETVDFAGGTEAVSARYPAGTLLIIEYTNPQLSIAADEAFRQRIGADASIVYRRIGNYSAFVFDVSDAAAANALLDQISYGKTVQWLGEDPFLIAKIERYFAQTGRDVAISTVLWLLLVFAITIAIGVLAGFAYFRYRESKRAAMTAFSDAGGLTRLNLDDLSEPLP